MRFKDPSYKVLYGPTLIRLSPIWSPNLVQIEHFFFILENLAKKYLWCLFSVCRAHYLGDVKLKNKLARETKQICLLNHGLRHFVCFFTNFMETSPGH